MRLQSTHWKTLTAVAAFVVLVAACGDDTTPAETTGSGGEAGGGQGGQAGEGGAPGPEDVWDDAIWDENVWGP